MDYVRIAYYTGFPSSVDLFHTSDPDSYVVLSACYDSLLDLGENGEILPCLATSYRTINPLCMEFNLRRGVKFHHGKEFTAKDVFATFSVHLNPVERTLAGKGMLLSIKDVEIVDEYTVRVHTFFPDSMLIWRMVLFASIAPHDIIYNNIDLLKTQPIGTGPYIFESMIQDQSIRFKANPSYWDGPVKNSGLVFPVIPSQHWLKALNAGEIDLIFGLPDLFLPLASQNEKIKINSKLCAIVHWFLLASKGPLMDKRVRKALNYAVDNTTLAKILMHGSAIPQTSIATEGQFGFNEEVKGYPYDKAKAVELMIEAGYPDGFELSGIVTDHSAFLVQFISVYLEDIKVKLNYEIVSRPHWFDKITSPRLGTGERYQTDFAVAPIDNPCMYSGFSHYIYLSDDGFVSIGSFPPYQERFIEAMVETDLTENEKKLKALDAYVNEEALFLFTIQSSLHTASCEGVDIIIQKTGYLGHFSLKSIVDDRKEKIKLPEYDFKSHNPREPINTNEFLKLLNVTSHQSIFWMPEQNKFQDPRLQELKENLKLYEDVKNSQSKFYFSQLVNYVNQSREFKGVFGSSIIGIATYNLKGELLLYNDTFANLMGDDVKNLLLSDFFLSEQEWLEFKDKIEKSFYGSCDFKRSDGTILNARVSASLRKGEQDVILGYLIMIRDEKEEIELKKALEKSYQELELKVDLRTHELTQTLKKLKLTQATLIQSEKMAALGQLVAGVAHEINTPLGAISSSISNISLSFKDLINSIVTLIKKMSLEEFEEFLALIQSFASENRSYSSLEARKIRKELALRLDAESIPESDQIAYTLMMMGGIPHLEKLIPYLKNPLGKELITFGFNYISLEKNSKNIQEAVSRASKVLFALKNYAHFEATGKKNLLSVIEEIENILVLYRSQIRQGVEVITKYSSSVPPIWGYHDELNQVWTNIIHNALYAMKNKGTLQIEVDSIDHSVIVKITDSGCGIPPEILDRVFEPFFTTKPKGEGSGLGLDIAKKIIQKHEGSIQVESIPGQTTFSITLPIGKDLKSA